MIVFRTRYARIGEALFGAPADGPRVDLVRHLQRPTPLPGAAECAPFNTLLIDLARDEADVLLGIKKGTRYEIRRAESDGVRCETSRDLEAFGTFFASFATTKGISSPPAAQLLAYAEHGALDLSLARSATGEILVWHAHLVANGRARLYLSATSDRGAQTGRANRSLHWFDIRRFKAAGCQTYDLGGWEGESPDPELRGISKFKEEFGGRVVEEFTCLEICTLRGRAYKLAEKLLAARRPTHRPVKSARESLRCPEDGGALADRASELHCASCGRSYPVDDGIVRFVTTLDSDDKQSEMLARDEEAARYDSRFSALRNAIEMPPSLAALAPRRDDRVVELGCGSGRMTLAYADDVGCVVAIDFSLASLRVLRAKLSPAQRERVLLVQADICKPPLERGAFTKVVSFQVFEHLPTPELRVAAMRAARGLVATGGAIVLSVYNWNLNKQHLSARGIGDNTAKEGFHAGSHRVYYFNFEPRDLHELFAAAGFRLLQLRGLDAQVPLIDRIGRWAIPVNRLLERVPFGTRLGHLLLARGVAD